jgi:hypothetical protein
MSELALQTLDQPEQVKSMIHRTMYETNATIMGSSTLQNKHRKHACELHHNKGKGHGAYRGKLTLPFQREDCDCR